jgi:hypothetical protein
MMNYIEYKTIDLDKIKTVDDIVLILKSHPQFIDYKCAKGEEWQTLGHLLSDETFREAIGEE